jgi:hypothetical protein
MNKRAMLGAAISLALFGSLLTIPSSAQIPIGQYTPVAPSGALTLATGGTAQNLFAAGEVVHGCTIVNPSTATEAIWVDFTGAAAVAAAGHTSVQLAIGTPIPCGVGLSTSVSWIAATTGHAISASRW